MVECLDSIMKYKYEVNFSPLPTVVSPSLSIPPLFLPPAWARSSISLQSNASLSGAN